MARAASYGTRKWSSGVVLDATQRGLPPAVARVPYKCLWTRRWPVKCAANVTFHFGLSTFNFDFGPNFYYISSNLVRLGPPILID